MADHEVEKRKKNTKNRLYQVRLTEEDAELFEAISYETEDTRAEVFRKALKLYASIKRNKVDPTFFG